MNYDDLFRYLGTITWMMFNNYLIDCSWFGRCDVSVIKLTINRGIKYNVRST